MLLFIAEQFAIRAVRAAIALYFEEKNIDLSYKITSSCLIFLEVLTIENNV